MKIVLMLSVLGLLVVACQNSDSSHDSNTGDSSQMVVEKQVACSELPAATSILGKWQIVTRQNDIRSVSTIQFGESAMVMTNLSTKADLQCLVSGRGAYKLLQPGEFEVLNDIADYHVVTSTDGKSNLDCQIHVPSNQYAYTFKGGCLVLSVGGQNYEMTPIQ